MIVLKILLFILILYGLCLLIQSKLAINRWFTPVVAFTSIGTLMFISGLLNFMPLMVFIISSAGLLALISPIVRYRKVPLLFQKEDLIPVICLAFLGAYLLYFCKGGIYQDGDTLTHWGIIIRSMIQDNRLPNFTNTEIGYQSYPPATACLVYFFCKITGYTEGHAMIAQAFLVLSCSVTLLAFHTKQKTKITGFLTLIFIIFSLVFNTGIPDLRVDNIIGMLSLSAIAMIIFYFDAPRLAALPLVPVLTFLAVTKNSGLVFMLFALAALLPSVHRHAKNRSEKLKILLPVILVPLGSFYLWEKHIRMVYASAGSTRHSVSIHYMKNIFQSKSPEDIQQIVRQFVLNSWLGWDTVWDWRQHYELIILAVFLAVFTIIYILNRRGILSLPVHTGKIVLTVLILYLLYKILELSMYLFNMPVEDALRLGGYARYSNSVAIVIYGFTFIFAIMTIQHLSENGSAGSSFAGRKTKNRIAIAVLTSILLLVPCIDRTWTDSYKRPDYQNGGTYRQLVRIKSDNSIDLSGKTLLVYSAYPYIRFPASFCFWYSKNVSSVSSAADLAASLQDAETDDTKSFDYLIVLDHPDDVTKVLKDYDLPADREFITMK